MKNIMAFLSPHKSFSNDRWGKESEALIKVQLEMAQQFWVREDIILVTNFPYEHQGVKALEIGDEHYCEMRPTATKVLVILELFKRGLIGDDIYWFHDLDAFQLAPIIVDLKKDMALTDYGITTIRPSYNLRWSTGSWFFKKGAKDLFEKIKERMYQDEINEETALGRLIMDDPGPRDRIEKLNITYNMATRKRDIERTYELAEKPIKVLHFHPYDDRKLYNGKTNMETVSEYVSEDFMNILRKHL